jgi:hypothetical protein
MAQLGTLVRLGLGPGKPVYTGVLRSMTAALQAQSRRSSLRAAASHDPARPPGRVALAWSGVPLLNLR